MRRSYPHSQFGGSMVGEPIRNSDITTLWAHVAKLRAAEGDREGAARAKRARQTFLAANKIAAMPGSAKR
jgi:hypothetical protein